MKKIFFAIIVLVASFVLFACSAFGPSGYDTDGGWSGSPHVSGWKGGNQNRPSAGQLTSGEWSDIKNYDFYQNLFVDEDPEIEEDQGRNNFYQFIDYFGFETRFKYTVHVLYDDQGVSDATVELYDADQNRLFTAKTDARGNAFLYPSYNVNGESITVKVQSGAYESVQTFIHAENYREVTLGGRTPLQSVLDLMFVIDTTGSMGDELNYLKAEIADVISTISQGNPGYTINLALLFYRDIGDEYVTRYFDFTTNIAYQQQNLARQSANGGGDFPEAADRALEEAVAKNWNNENATRLIFHVCDAPPHSDQESQTRYYNAIKKAAERGIRIIPVASSGIDLATEYLLRQEALMTGGTYIFLTDDSGIGNSHLEPTVGEYIVEYLNAGLVRIINEYLTGIETEPVPYY